MNELEQARQSINRLNAALVKLLEERFTAVTQVNHYKEEHHLPVLDAQRETAVLKQVEAAVADPQKAPFIAAVFEEIMHQSRAYEEALRKDE